MEKIKQGERTNQLWWYDNEILDHYETKSVRKEDREKPHLRFTQGVI